MPPESRQPTEPDEAVPVTDLAGVRRALHDPEAVVVDVLPWESWDRAHIPGAVHLPLGELERRAPAVLPDRNAEIIAYCAKPT